MEMTISSDDMLFTFGVEIVPTGSWLHNISLHASVYQADVKGTPLGALSYNLNLTAIKPNKIEFC